MSCQLPKAAIRTISPKIRCCHCRLNLQYNYRDWNEVIGIIYVLGILNGLSRSHERLPKVLQDVTLGNDEKTLEGMTR